MSHYLVAVFVDEKKGEDLDELLAPYNEELEVAEYLDEDGEKQLAILMQNGIGMLLVGVLLDVFHLKMGKKKQSQKFQILILESIRRVTKKLNAFGKLL